MEEESLKYHHGLMYLRRESIAPGNGKNIRLYRMDKWFLGEFHDKIMQVVSLIDKGRTGTAVLASQGGFQGFSVVFQDVFTFSFPLVENVSCLPMGQKDEKRLQESLEKAGLWEKVSSLPKGLATVMNKDLDEQLSLSLSILMFSARI